MLIYHPMFDPYHCALRLASILIDRQSTNIEWDRLRLLDFFVTFPHLMKTIRLPEELRPFRRMIRSIPEPYESLPSPPRLFFQLSEIQSHAARLLAARGFLDTDALIRDSLSFVKLEATSRLEQITGSAAFRASEWYAFIVSHLSRLPIHGKDGLKERSGLMEFRHDPV